MRIRIVLAACKGHPNQEIASDLGVSEMMVSKWRRAFARNGIDGLQDRARSGRPRKTPPAAAIAATAPAPSPAIAPATNRLISNFKQLIAAGKLSPGSKLPPERTLAQQFGVSRPSLRQALKVMEIMGVLQQHVGDGTYLNANASTILAEPMDFLILLDGISFHELVEARMILEPELAARAADRATSDDLASLRAAMQGIDAARDPAAIARHDIAFHEAVYRAASNRVCQLMLAMLHRVILASMMRAPELRPAAVSNEQHRRIYSAIAARQPRNAHQHMLDHLRGYLPLLESMPKPLPRRS